MPENPISESALPFASIEQLAPLIRKKKISPVELTKLMLCRIERLDPQLNAYITVTAELALEQARRAEAEIAAPRSRAKYRGVLHGIPVSLKDNIETRGIRTTGGSKILADFVPNCDATIIQRLREAGAVILGKTNLHEFAYGVTSNNPHFGPVRNPWDRNRIPGGSSGGSAAALAAGLCYASIGTDTGGSIRIPAALCGVVGFKPQFRAVSLDGIIPLSTSLDHVGPLARTAADAALVFSAIRIDPNYRRSPDLESSMRPFKNIREFHANLPKSPRLGIPRDYFGDDIDAEIREIVMQAAREFELLGASIEEIPLPNVHRCTEPSNAIALAEARAYHERRGWYPARAADYGEDVRQRLEMGEHVLAMDYIASENMRSTLGQDFEPLVKYAESRSVLDALLVPTVPIQAPVIGAEKVSVNGNTVSVRAELIRLNRPANYFRMPAISIPCGFTRDGLPVGLQLIAGCGRDFKLLRIASMYEQAHDWHRRCPPLNQVD